MPTFILMAGLPGSGKTTLALALELNGVVLNKDALRAAVFPGSLTDFTREQDDLCFIMLVEAAKYLAARNRTDFIFLDGRTFSRREQLDQTIRAAQAAGCNWKILLATCPDEIAEARLIQDAQKHPAANRTVELYREVKARFEPIAYPHLEIDTSQPAALCVRHSIDYLAGE